MLVAAFIRDYYIPPRIEICDQYAKKLYSVVGKFAAFLGHDATLSDFTEQSVGNYLTHYRKSWSARSTNNQRQVLLSLWIDAADNPKLAAMIVEHPRPKKIRKLKEDTEPPRCWRKSQIKQLVAYVQTLDGMVGDVSASIWWLSLILSIHWTSSRIGAMMTGMALSIGALVGNVAVDTVQAAMTETTTHDVRNWCRLHLGPTVQSVRQRIRQAIHTEQKQKPLRLESG
jgi:hypothetical protein